MLLTISTTMQPATDLGFLVHKHPDKAQAYDVTAGVAHVVWPEAAEERSTVALLLEVDPIGLVRRKGKSDGFSLAQYVNDRPYAASSLLAVAIGKVFRTALAGRCTARPDLVGQDIPLEIALPAVPGGEDLVHRLFGPLGWEVETMAVPLDEQIPAWGDSDHVALRLRGEQTIQAALSHLYVLLPVLDDSKHYWVGEDEVDKLVRVGSGWLSGHPEQELIARRYLRHQRDLVLTAVDRLAETDDLQPAEVVEDAEDAPPPATPLHRLRKAAVLEQLRTLGASSVVDLGCGEGVLLRDLVKDPAFGRVIGVDVSHRALKLAERRLGLDRMPDSQRARLELLQSSVTYRDDRLAGHDAIVLMEVVEHVDFDRLPALERSVFRHARPKSVIVTTPNSEFNVRYLHLAHGDMRHHDHRFEWSRAEFRRWSDTIAEAYGYSVLLEDVGEVDPSVGPPTQMAVFRRVA